MDTDGPASREQVGFGALLKRYRVAAGLSQEALAERARLSVGAVSAYERGLRQAPFRDTVALLVEALGLAASEAAALEATVPRRRGVATGLHADDVPSAEGAVEPIARDQHDAPAPAAALLPDLPTGTLTFLLTDIVDSTAYWDRHPAAMQAAIVRHDALIDEVLARHGGRQIKERGEGDSIFAVFTSPTSALAAVRALQQALLAEPWPRETQLRVRMGLHSGEADLRGIGYYGATISRTARIRSLAHGGQILLSQSTYDLVRDTLPEGVRLRSLGAHGLKGLQRPEEVYQVLHPGLPADFPPLPSPQAPPTNLPVQVTSFVGREQEQATVLALLGHSHLVTLTGAGGAGKTRLLLQVAVASVETCPDGVWLVELASLADPVLVPQVVAAVLGVREEPGRPLSATLAAYLQPKALLLLLDNCEHLVGACAELANALLRTCPKLRILASSREGLLAAGETTYRVPSLSVPDLDHLPMPEQLAGYEAVQLFVERARARRPEFSLSAKNARAVAQICARLDGMPLAIELAAARVSALPVEAILARLDDRFRLLTGGPRSALPRQQTLRAALDWSHDLLSDQERLLLRRLSVFAGGWTLEQAEEVCVGQGIEAWEVLDVLGSLVNKSLILPEERDGEAHYRLLETIREYVLERLAMSGEQVEFRRRHAGYYLRQAEAAEPELHGPRQGRLLNQLETEHDNLRAALAWSLASGEAALGIRLAGALSGFWYLRGYVSEGRGWLERALARLDMPGSEQEPAAAASGDPRPLGRRKVEAQLHEGLGDAMELVGQHDEARAAYQRALALIPVQSAAWRARLHQKTGNSWRSQRRFQEALQAYDVAEAELGHEPSEAAVAWWREWVGIQIQRLEASYWQGNVRDNVHEEMRELVGRVHLVVEQYATPAQRGSFFRSLVLMAFRRDRYRISDETLAHAKAALAAIQESGDLNAIGFARFHLGFTYLWRGEFDEAEREMHGGLALAERTGDVALQSRYLTYLAVIYRRQGQVEETRRYVARALEVATAGQMHDYIATGKANLAWLEWCDGNLAGVRVNGRAALELWQHYAPGYPLQWLALLPLIGVALAKDQRSEAADYARMLLASTQMALPDVLVAALAAALQAEEHGQPEAISISLERALALARESRFL